MNTDYRPTEPGQRICAPSATPTRRASLLRPARGRRRQLIKPVSAALLCWLTAGVSVAGLPAISEPPTNEYRHGKLVWADLVTTDLAGARRFYGELFGWSFAELGTDRVDYLLAYHAGAPIAGIAQRQPQATPPRQSGWIAFMSVADVSAAAGAVTAQGGAVLITPRPVPGRGDMAVLADPDGAPFGVVHSSSGDPPDYLPAVGEWIWALYQSHDATSAAAFYQALAGYEVIPDARAINAPHFLLAADGYARASLVEIPAERGLRPDWLYFVRVSDVRASVARASALGGGTLVAPDPGLFGGQVAVVADPNGAPLGLLEWNLDEEGDR